MFVSSLRRLGKKSGRSGLGWGAACAVLLALTLAWLLISAPRAIGAGAGGGGDDDLGLRQNETLPIITLAVGDKKLRTELARTPRQMAQGMMFRRTMRDNDGMLFFLEKRERASFWMKNCPLPLSVAYIDKDGVILEIYDMQPYDETPVPSKSDQIEYALETNQGWYELNSVKPGDKIVPEGDTLLKLRAAGGEAPPKG